LTNAAIFPILGAMKPPRAEGKLAEGTLAEGKLPPELLERLLRHTSRSSLLTVGAFPGEDAAVAAGSDTLVLTADPITFTDERIGAYTVAVNANDIVAMGGRPIYLTTTILLPPGTGETEVERIFADIADACRKAGLLWVGGHTEVTPVVKRTIVAGQAVGFLFRAPLSTGGARPGDALCMSKWVGLEGTTTIARERPAESRESLGEQDFRAVLGWLDDPGISIVEEGRALEGLLLSSGHDPTEGGVAMGIHEICRRSGTGAMVVFDALPIRDETRRLCARFAMDPLGLLSSGVFLFTAPRGVAEEACRLLLARQIPASIIGEIREQGEGVTIQRGSKREALPFSVQDEIVKLRRPTARPSSPRPSTR
jgi:hydrogenase expression/formation protein HypE